ncbi:MAG TPA: tRNA (adenosine(37)-N6)-dimethylallyltransferase MiaA [Puia sp.]|nr:tRNA (adenosine(37)-N6)-dimethylallyltransferase MiaA [Puia sp.]
MKNKTAIIIVGPTAVGKTSVAIQVARHFHTKIISADSRQCFKELNIGVAKPSSDELRLVHHYFIDSHSIYEDVNAALFEQLSIRWVEEIFQENDIAVMVGGTGLYVKAFCEGLDEMPAIDLSVRKEIQQHYQNEGIDWLQEQIKNNDVEFYQSGEMQNPQRMMRALEVKLSTGRSIFSFRSQQKKQRAFNIKKIGLQLPKEELHRNINNRVDDMISKGLVDEAKDLFQNRHLNALQTVGYSELFDFFEGKINLEEAVELIKKNTRHYAKRQMTWFRKDENIQWLAPTEWEQIKKITQS